MLKPGFLMYNWEQPFIKGCLIKPLVVKSYCRLNKHTIIKKGYLRCLVSRPLPTSVATHMRRCNTYICPPGTKTFIG